MSDIVKVELFDGKRIVGDTVVPLEWLKVTPRLTIRCTERVRIVLTKRPRGRLSVKVGNFMKPIALDPRQPLRAKDTIDLDDLTFGIELLP